MQKGRVVRLRTFGIIEFFKKNSFLLFITFLFTIGFIIGIFAIGNSETLNTFSKEQIESYIKIRTDYGFLKVFLNSAFRFSAVIFAVFLLGTSVFGVITVPLLLVLQGIIKGGITSYLYLQYGLKGIAFNAIIYIPPTILFIIVLSLMSCRSMRFSIKLSSLTLAETLPFNLSGEFKNYTVNYLVLSLFSVFCALLDAVISSGLIKHFNL